MTRTTAPARTDPTTRPGGIRLVGDDVGHRVTSLELYFDLAYVFAFTQVSRLMAAHHDALGVMQGLAVLALLWWSWTAFAWLANLARSDRGVVRAATVIGMGAVFVVGLAVPEAFDDAPGGLPGPLVLAVAYLVARAAHAVVLLAAATHEPASRRRIAATVLLPQVPAAALLLTGAVVGGPWQLACVLGAVAVEPVVSWLLARGAVWQLHSPVHLAERYRLVVILALGESVLAIGTGLAGVPLDGPGLTGVVLAFAVSVAMWWAYFPRLADAAEDGLRRVRGGARRARTALDAYTYLHLVLVAGIVVTALGIEVAVAHLGDPGPLGAFGGLALGAGVACYLAGTALVARRVLGRWAPLRLAGAVAALASAVPLSAVAPVAALAGTAGLLVVLQVAEPTT